MIPRLTTKTVVGQRSYNFGFDYLARDFVKVEVDGKLLEYDKDYTVNGRTVEFVVTPTEVKPLYIYRDTTTIPLVDWKDSSIMTARDLNLQQTQTAHLTEELLDTAQQTKFIRDETKELKEKFIAENASLSELSKSIVSVKLFGAVGDGVTDDTKAFKKANDNLSGKILLIPKGNYVIQEHMSFDSVADVMDYGTYTYVKPFYPNETPMLQGANNIAKLADFQYDEPVNQVQGFTYNDKKDVFVIACINSDSTVQHIYEINAETMQRVGKYEFAEERLGHCNTLAYNKHTDKIYLTNGKAYSNNIVVLNANTMQIENSITLNERVFNLAYDPITRTYASIVPVSGSQRLRDVNLYGDSFKLYKSYRIDYEYNDFNNNGALMLNGAVMSATLGSLVEITPFGHLKQIIEFNPKYEIEDIAYRKGKFYFAVLIMQPNKKHKVEIYIGNPSKSFENSLATQQLEASFVKTTGGLLTGAPILANNISLQGKDSKGTAHHLARITDKDSFELGMADTDLILVGKRNRLYDRAKNKTGDILSTVDIGTTIPDIATIESTYLKKAGGELTGALILPNGVSIQGKDANGGSHHIARIMSNGTLEIGMGDTETVFVGKTFKYFDRTDNKTYRVATEKDLKNILTTETVDAKIAEVKTQVEAKADKATTEQKLNDLTTAVGSKIDANSLTPYLTKNDATTSYLSKDSAQDTYLSKADAETTYAKKSEIPAGGGGGGNTALPYSEVTSANDWNTYTDNGVYKVTVTGGANVPTAQPWGVLVPNGFLKVSNYGNGKFIDQYYYTANGEVYYRFFADNRWRTWGRIQTSLNGSVHLYGGKELK